MKKIIGLSATLTTLALLALPAMAQIGIPADPGEPVASPITDWATIRNLINNFAYLIYAIFGLLAVVMFVWAGIEYLTAGGDSTKLQTAKQRVMYGIIAIVVVILSVGIFALIRNIIGTFSA